MDAVGAVIVIGIAAPPLVALYYRRTCGGTWAGTTAYSELPPLLSRVRACLRRAAWEPEPR